YPVEYLASVIYWKGKWIAEKLDLRADLGVVPTSKGIHIFDTGEHKKASFAFRNLYKVGGRDSSSGMETAGRSHHQVLVGSDWVLAKSNALRFRSKKLKAHPCLAVERRGIASVFPLGIYIGMVDMLLIIK